MKHTDLRTARAHPAPSRHHHAAPTSSWPFAAALIVMLGATTAASAGTYNWNSINAGNWSDTSANGWNAAAYPQVAGDVAVFQQNLAANVSVGLDVSVSVASLTLNGGAFRWWLTGGTGTLTFDNGTDEATLIMAGADMVSRPMVLNSDLRVTQGGSGQLSQLISGNGSLTKYGVGVTLLGQNNSYQGDTIVKEGKWRIQSVLLTTPFSGGDMVADGGYFDFNNANGTVTGACGTVSTTLTYAGGGGVSFQATPTTFVVGHAAATSSALVRGGRGTLQILTANSSTLGDTRRLIVNGLSSAANINGMYDAAVFTLVSSALGSYVKYDTGTAGFVYPTYTTRSSGPVTLPANELTDVTGSFTANDGSHPYALRFGVTGKTLTIAADATLTVGNGAYAAGTSSGQAGMMLINPSYISGGSGSKLELGAAEGIVSVISGAGHMQVPIHGTAGLTKCGGGMLYLTADNAFSGGIVVNEGTLRVNDAGALGADFNAMTINGGALDLGGYNPTIATLGGNDIGAVVNNGASASVLTSRFDTVTSSFAGAIRNGSQLTGLAKAGTGALILSGASTYTGTTTVEGGFLQIDGSLGDTAVGVTGGTLGGIGMIDGSVTIGSGGVLAPGTNSLGIGMLTVGNLTLQTGATYRWEGGASAGDVVTVPGTVTLPASMSVTVNRPDASVLATEAVLIDSANAITGGDPADWTVTSLYPADRTYAARLSDTGKQVLLYVWTPSETVIVIR